MKGDPYDYERGNNTLIEFRSLKESELEAWSNHCKSVFNQAFGFDFGDYFIKKWFNDPWRDLDSILVAVHKNLIISTIRIFYRNIYSKMPNS